jgi:hypothetical protein
LPGIHIYNALVSAQRFCDLATMHGHSPPILDKQIRGALACIIRQQDSDAIIIDELPLLRNGRADIAAVNGVMAGYEIKSERDSLARLPSQIPMYEAVFDYCNIVVAPMHLRRARELVPSAWGIFVADSDAGILAIQRRRRAKPNRNIQHGAVLRLLWRPELARLLRSNGIRCEGTSIRRLWTSAEQLSQDVIREAAREALKVRAFPSTAQQ